jgi:medium-chain acyl-[acyl-carrier-protein] hydrolase
MDAAVSRHAAPSPWFMCPKPNAHPKVRLFCLPFAGGGASAYHGWPQAFPQDVEIRAVQLPGREWRMRERRVTDALELAQGVAHAIEPYLDRPFALFGYSMGALLAFETARALRRRRQPLPIHLFVAAMRAPHVPSAVPPLARLPQDQLLGAVRRHYQPPEDVFSIPQLLELFLPVLRDDMTLVDDYAYYAEAPLPCAIDAYVGAHDRSISIEAAERWRDQTAGPFALTVFPGNHFFLPDALPELQRKVAARLHAVVGDRR